MLVSIELEEKVLLTRPRAKPWPVPSLRRQPKVAALTARFVTPPIAFNDVFVLMVPSSVAR